MAARLAMTRTIWIKQRDVILNRNLVGPALTPTSTDFFPAVRVWLGECNLSDFDHLTSFLLVFLLRDVYFGTYRLAGNDDAVGVMHAHRFYHPEVGSQPATMRVLNPVRELIIRIFVPSSTFCLENVYKDFPFRSERLGLACLLLFKLDQLRLTSQ
jgi:hypothetical protein